jgi:membrane protease YdiL (CAAX protease family)
MNDHPVFLLIMLTIGSYVANLWREDLIAWRAEYPSGGALPGATTCSAKACIIAIAGALVILAIETGGEIALGLDDEQSTITVLFGIYTLLAAFIEELIFRGFIVMENKGRILCWVGIIAASIVFAALHPFLWSWEDGVFSWTLTTKGWFSTVIVFISSLWFYAMRFAWFNPHRSLLPCIAAHAAKNLCVFAIKGAQGFVNGWW